MANRFEKATWADRQVQYPSRRRLTATAETDVWDVERIEGEIIEAGKAFGDTNMSNLENRIYNAFETLESSDIKMTDAGNIFTATTVDGALSELFTYAGNGKTAIATAIGSEASPSNTFTQLANTISGGKLQIATALGDPALQTSTFAYLAYLANYYRTEANAKKRVLMQEITITETSYTTGNIVQNISLNIPFVPVTAFLVGVRTEYEGKVTKVEEGFSNYEDRLYELDNLSQTGFTITMDGSLSKRFMGSPALAIIIG